MLKILFFTLITLILTSCSSEESFKDAMVNKNNLSQPNEKNKDDIDDSADNLIQEIINENPVISNDKELKRDSLDIKEIQTDTFNSKDELLQIPSEEFVKTPHNMTTDIQTEEVTTTDDEKRDMKSLSHKEQLLEEPSKPKITLNKTDTPILTQTRSYRIITLINNEIVQEKIPEAEETSEKTEEAETFSQIFSNDTPNFISEQETIRDIDTDLEQDLLQEESIQEELIPNDNILPSITSSIQTKNIELIAQSGFSYENQREVTIEISAISSLLDTQVLLYENNTPIPTPVGTVMTMQNLIISTIFDTEGNLNLTHTFGNHITSIWLVIPFYGIKMEIPITDNYIYLMIQEGEES